MLVTVEVDKASMARVVAKVEGIALPSSRRTYFERLGAIVLRWVDRNFRTSGGLVGGWRPLAPLTIFGKRAGSSVPLETLRQWFSSQATEDDVRVGTVRAVARYHQFGTGLAAGGSKYPIKPRIKKALAFPAPPLAAYSMGVGLFLKRTPRGTAKTGLTTTTAVRAVFPEAKIPKGKGSLQSFAVVRGVMHPGVAVRRMLPNVDEAAALVQEASRDWFTTMMNQLSQNGRPEATQDPNANAREGD